MKVVVAPDKFKGALTAREVAEAVARGVGSRMPACELVTVPVADGGEGTLDAALAAGFEPVGVAARGPTGVRVDTSYARRGATTLIEMASVCGLPRLPGRPEPLASSSHGLGEVLGAALVTDVEVVVLGVGGSASTDGGAGMLAALGARILDRHGRPVAPGGAGLLDAVTLELAELPERVAGVDVVLAADVDNPLTGPEGAAVVFAPQKGAAPGEVQLLETALCHWADLVAATLGTDLRDRPGAGAAGGVGFGAMTVLGARRRSGVDVVLDLVGFDAAVQGADLVVVGEGALDEQTLHGKAPLGAARRAADAGAEVVAVCGRRALDDDTLRSVGITAAYSCLEMAGGDERRSMARTPELLEEIGALVADRHLRVGPVPDPVPETG